MRALVYGFWDRGLGLTFEGVRDDVAFAFPFKIELARNWLTRAVGKGGMV